MAFSSGTFTLVAGNPVVSGSTISTSWTNDTLSDIATAGLSLCFVKDGQSTPTANIPFSGFRIMNLAAAGAASDALRAAHMQNGAVWTLGQVSGASTIAGSPSPVPAAYAQGQTFLLWVVNNQSSQATLNVASLGARSIFWNIATATDNTLRANRAAALHYLSTASQTGFHILGYSGFLSAGLISTRGDLVSGAGSSQVHVIPPGVNNSILATTASATGGIGWHESLHMDGQLSSSATASFAYVRASIFPGTIPTTATASFNSIVAAGAIRGSATASFRSLVVGNSYVGPWPTTATTVITESVFCDGRLNASTASFSYVVVNQLGAGTGTASSVAFLAVKTSAQNDFATAGTTVVTYQDRIFDLDGTNFSTASSVYTAPKSGRYLFNVSVALADNVNLGASANLRLRTSNRTYQHKFTMDGMSAKPSNWTAAMQVTADMDSGDTAQVEIAVTASAGGGGGTITFDAATAASAFAQTAITGFTVGSDSNRVLYVAVNRDPEVDVTCQNVAWRDSGGTASQNLTQIAYISSVTASSYTQLWRLYAPNSGAKDIRVNFASPATCFIGVVSYSGVHQTSANEAVVAYHSNTTTVSSDISVSSSANSRVVDFLRLRGNVATQTVGAGQTERATVATPGGGGWFGISDEAGTASVTMSWAGSAAVRLHIAISLNPGTAAASTGSTDIMAGSTASMMSYFSGFLAATSVTGGGGGGGTYRQPGPTQGGTGGLPYVPNASGYGCNTRHAYAGTSAPQILRVTHLGGGTTAGSFGWAITQRYPRIIVFDVGGVIQANTSTVWTMSGSSASYCYIAGQTAPTPGITLRGGAALEIANCHDVVVQHIKVRPGDANQSRDGIHLIADSDYCYNVVLDHCSVSWSTDGNVDMFQNAGFGVHDVSVRYCIIAEGLHNNSFQSDHSTGALAVSGTTTASGTGNNRFNITYANNLFARNAYRNPRVADVHNIMIVNNLIYGSRGNQLDQIEVSAHYGTNVYGSICGNNFIPSSVGSASPTICLRGDEGPGGIHVYLGATSSNDNRGPLYSSANHLAIVSLRGMSYGASTADNIVMTTSNKIGWAEGVVEMPTIDVESFILTNAGAFSGDRDSIDARIVNAVSTRTNSGTATAFINNESAVGGYSSTATASVGLVLPNNPHDVMPSGYTRLEEWLHEYLQIVEGL